MSVISELARFVREARAANLADDERAMLRRHVADIAMAGVAGARTHEASPLRALAPGAGEDGAIAIAAAIVRHTEVDDIHLRSCTTPGSVAIPVAFMLASQGGPLDAARVADAVWVGTELVTRFGIAIDGASALARGVWPTAVAAPLGAAAVAARMWDFDQAQTEHALSLALMLMAGRTGRFQGALWGRWVLFIGAIAEGLRAARAARQGFCGDASLLDGPWLEKAQGMPADVSALTRGLGESSIYPALSMKPFCTARQALGPTDIFMSLMAEGLDPRRVDAITIRAPATYVGMISQPIDPGNRSSGFVNAGFQMGLAAFRRDHLWDLDRSAVMNDPDVLAFAGKVRVVADADLQKEFPARWPAAVEVSAGGEIIERLALSITGDPDRRLDDARTRDKGMRMLRPLVGDARAAEIAASAFSALDDPASCRRVATMFAEAAKG